MSADQAARAIASSTSPGGVWARERRALTVGLVLAVTLVAFEALAIATVLPVVSRQLGDLRLYGWVFSAFLLVSLVGIVLAGLGGGPAAQLNVRRAEVKARCTGGGPGRCRTARKVR